MSTKKINIRGIAVSEGTSRNKRKYLASELEKFAPSMMGKPILKDHEGYTDNVIGKVTESVYDASTKSVRYAGWIKEDGSGIVEKMKDGRISEVSIGAIAGKIVKEKKDDEVIIPVDLEALELSTTPVPGNRGTSVLLGDEKLSKKNIKHMINTYEKSQSYDKNNIIRKEDKYMETTTENFDSNNVEIQKLQEDCKALKESTETLKKEKAKLLETMRQDAVNKYKNLCEVKGISPKDLSEANMEMINFAIEMAEDIPEEAEEKPEAKPEKEAAEKPVEKEEAKPESKEAESENEDAEEAFEGYVITTEDVSGRGVALYKYY